MFVRYQNNCLGLKIKSLAKIKHGYIETNLIKTLPILFLLACTTGAFVVRGSAPPSFLTLHVYASACVQAVFSGYTGSFLQLSPLM